MLWSLLIHEYFSFFFLIRRKQRQKSRRRRKMEIRKRQKWRPKVSPSPFAALSYQPGQHCVIELVLSVILRNSPFGLLPCFHIALESFKKVAMHPFLWNVIYWSLKWAFFLLVLVGPHHEISSFHFTCFYIGMLKAQSLLYRCWPDSSFIQAAAHPSKAHVDLSDSLKGPKISFKQGIIDS